MKRLAKCCGGCAETLRNNLLLLKCVLGTYFTAVVLAIFVVVTAYGVFLPALIPLGALACLPCAGAIGYECWKKQTQAKITTIGKVVAPTLSAAYPPYDDRASQQSPYPPAAPDQVPNDGSSYAVLPPGRAAGRDVEPTP